MKVLIVDDEKAARERLRKMLSCHRDIVVVGESQDGLSALADIETLMPDIVFLDIEMPELNGLEVARTLGVTGPLVVFVTAYDEHALEAFEANAIDYLVKPVSDTRLEKALLKIRRSTKVERAVALQNLISNFSSREKSRRLAVRIGNKFEVFDPMQVSTVVARDHYASIYIDGRELLSDDSLDSLERRLDASTFVRVHRSSIININYLKELRRMGDRKYTAVIADKNQSQIQVSRERLANLKEKLGLGSEVETSAEDEI